MSLLEKLFAIFSGQVSVTVLLGSGYDREAEEKKIREGLVSCIRTYLGVKYRLGAEVAPRDPMPEDIDCSELIELVYAKNDLEMPDGSQHQFKLCIPVQTPVPGDLGFLWSDKWQRIGHVAIYVGDNKIIHAVGGRGVVEDNRSIIEHSDRFRGWGRYPDFIQEEA